MFGPDFKMIFSKLKSQSSLKTKLLSGRAKITNTKPNNDALIAIWLKRLGIEIRPSFVAWPEIIPAIIAPKDDAKNQTPIIWPVYFFGDREEMAASPIGLRVNSPIVCKRYVIKSHWAPAKPSLKATWAPIAIIKKPIAIKIKPKQNLNGNDGSSIFFPR